MDFMTIYNAAVVQLASIPFWVKVLPGTLAIVYGLSLMMRVEHWKRLERNDSIE